MSENSNLISARRIVDKYGALQLYVNEKCILGGQRDLSHHLKKEHYVLYKVDCFKEKKLPFFKGKPEE